MADYGLKAWNASGVVTLDTTDTLARLVYATTATVDTTGSIDLSGIISGRTTVLLSHALPASGGQWGACPHAIARSGTVIEWVPQGDEATNFYVPSTDSLIAVWLIS